MELGLDIQLGLGRVGVRYEVRAGDGARVRESWG